MRVQVLMLRRCLTWLRATWVVRVLPLDQNILLHQIVGYAILLFTLVHTAAHVFNFGTNMLLFTHLKAQQQRTGEVPQRNITLHVSQSGCQTAVSTLCGSTC